MDYQGHFGEEEWGAEGTFQDALLEALTQTNVTDDEKKKIKYVLKVYFNI